MGSSTSVMCNPAYFDKTDNSEKVLDLVTNCGVMQSGLKCEVYKIGEAWLNNNSLINIFSFADIVNKFSIKHNSKIEDVF